MSSHHSTDMFRLYLSLGQYTLVALVGFRVWYSALKRARLVEDLPTSTVRSVAQGYAELVGRQYSVPGQATTAPLTGKPCTWWHYTIEEKRRSYADGGRRKSWVTIEEAVSSTLILFKDATGQLLVYPQGAEVEPSVTDCWHGVEASPPRPSLVNDVRGGHFRYTEKRMHEGDPLYVAGELHTYSAHRPADVPALAVSDRLNRWKQDQATLLERFDSDRDGRIDVGEWDAAREAAAAEVAARLQSNEMQPDTDVMRRPADGQPFLLAGKPQGELARKFHSAANVGLFFYLIGAAVVIYGIYLLRLAG